MPTGAPAVCLPAQYQECIVSFYIKVRNQRQTLVTILSTLGLTALFCYGAIWLTEPDRTPTPLRPKKLPPGTYFLNGKFYRHDTHEQVKAHVAALWATYEEAAADIYANGETGKHGYKNVVIPSALLREKLADTIQRMKKSHFHPEDLPADKIERFMAVLADCFIAESLADALYFCELIRASMPEELEGDPSGYYEDRTGGALCIIKKKAGFIVHAGAGRGVAHNSDHIKFSGRMIDDTIIRSDRSEDDDREAKIYLTPGMACLIGTSNRLDETYVRVGTITPRGLELLEGYLPLGNEISNDDVGNKCQEFHARGIVRFIPLPEETTDYRVEAERIVGYRRK